MPFESTANATYDLPPDIIGMCLPKDSSAPNNYSQCYRFDANFTEDYFEAGIPANKSVPCDDWVFDHSKYESSAVFEVFMNLMN
jgi:hypothetical protein